MAVWVATHAGRARFDGVQFRRFPLPSDTGRRRRMIRASLLDYQHSMWMASYSRLPAGNYRFRVPPCNNVGVWSEKDVGLMFVVVPFYWQTWWFRLVVGGSVLAAFGWSIRRFEKRKMQRRMETLERQHTVERERMRIARDVRARRSIPQRSLPCGKTTMGTHLNSWQSSL